MQHFARNVQGLQAVKFITLNHVSTNLQESQRAKKAENLWTTSTDAGIYLYIIVYTMELTIQ
jgi:hypothetical protein